MSKIIKEAITMKKLWTIRRFKNEKDWRADKLYNISHFENNVMLNSGLNELWELVCAATAVRFDNTNAQLGVGTDNTAEAPTQTDLIGTNFFKAMDGGYPTYGTSQLAIWRSTYQSAEANFAWEEFMVANGGDPGGADIGLNRKISSEGTKTAGQVWELTLQITLS